MRSKRSYGFALAVLLLLAASPIVMADVGPALQIDLVRGALTSFQDVNVAATSGYVQYLTCQISGHGAIGVPFVNEKLLSDAALDPLQPAALLYEPNGRKLKPAGVKYMVMAEVWRSAGHTSPPQLFGQTFHLTGSPNMFDLPPFFALDVWLWKTNPSGQFSPWNPAISCPWPLQDKPGT